MTDKFLVSCQTTIGEMSFIRKEWSDVVVTLLGNYGKTGHPEPSPGWYFTLYRSPEKVIPMPKVIVLEPPLCADVQIMNHADN